MHPYAGDPTSFPETALLIDDSDPPDASNFNVEAQANLDRTAWLRANLGTTSVLNWQEVRKNPTDPTPSINITAGSIYGYHAEPIFDSIQGYWVIPFEDYGSSGFGLRRLHASYGTPGDNWFSLLAAGQDLDSGNGGQETTYYQYSVAHDVANATQPTYYIGLTALIFPQANLTADVFRVQGTTISRFLLAGPYTGTGQTVPFDGSVPFNDVKVSCPALNTLIVGLSDANAVNSSIYWTTNANAASPTWSNVSSIPAKGPWFKRVGNGIVLFISRGAAAGSANGDQPFLYAWTGSTIVSRAQGFSGLVAAGDQCEGLAFISRTSLFVAAIRKANAAGIQWLSSPDGTTWTVLATLTSIKHVMGVQACGPFLTCISGLVGTGNAGVQLYSDDAGTTWRQTQNHYVLQPIPLGTPPGPAVGFGTGTQYQQVVQLGAWAGQLLSLESGPALYSNVTPGAVHGGYRLSLINAREPVVVT